MERITEKNLIGVMGIMARLMDIPPGPAWTPRADGKGSEARVGALVLQCGSKYYGNAWTVSQMVNTSGGESTLLRGTTARELFDACHAWIRGFEHARRMFEAKEAARNG